MNQQQNGGQWNLLGTYTQDQASQVALSSAANGYVVAGGIRLGRRRLRLERLPIMFGFLGSMLDAETGVAL